MLDNDYSKALYISLSTPDAKCSWQQLRRCLHDTFHWMSESRLKLNDRRYNYCTQYWHTKVARTKQIFSIRRLSQHDMSSVSTWNLGVLLMTTLISEENTFLRFVKRVIIIVIYSTFVDICIFLLQNGLQLR